MATKIFLVKEEYNNDGEIQNEVFPCISLEVAQRKVEDLYDDYHCFLEIEEAEVYE